MKGLTRADIDRAESKDFALGDKPIRPRDAATLLLLDRSGPEIRVLMGRRHRSHAFMPGKLVFPGGRTDPADGHISVVAELDPREEAKIVAGMGARASTHRARAIAMSAVRETYEEAGLLIGRKGTFETGHPHWKGFVDNEVQPRLDVLRFVARAITPPGRVRRFDTRFFAVWKENVALTLPGGGPTNELEDIVWLTIAEAREADVPLITHTVLGELNDRLSADPELAPGGPVPSFRMRYNKFVRDVV